MKSEKSYSQRVTLLSGGVGGAKLVLGVARCIAPSKLNVIVNTADDAVFHGLHVSPDLDTTMYTLAGIANPETGWGVVKDTFHALSSLGRYGEETWFRLGDRDLGTHILRTKLLGEGKTLTEITSLLSRKLGVEAKILPMADEKVETLVKLRGRWVPFQGYFVLKRGKGSVSGLRFKGIQNAKPTAQVVEALNKADFVVFAPSNPVVSILPILSLPGFKGLLKKVKASKVAVSPFIKNRAVSGTAKELIEVMGYEGSPVGLAKFYLGLIDLLVIDEQDADRRAEIEALGIQVMVTRTIMNTLTDRIRLAREILNMNQVRRKFPTRSKST
jgi:LPPG:FO 2-phospho-L-lactate transferase